MNANLVAFVVTAFVLAALAWRLWLAVRQARHVARHREAVPADFAGHVPLEAQRKAAD